MKLLWPGHNYLGPGNELDNGEPVDKADSIAQLHDYQYENARSVDDVNKADIEAIAKFGLNTLKEGDLASAAGAGGLIAKKYAEWSLGTILYPLDQNKYVKAVDSIGQFFGADSFLPNPNREHVGMPDNKKRKHEDGGDTGADSSTGEGTGEQMPQAGSSLPGGTGSDVMATIIKNPHLSDIPFYFKKTWQIYTGGFQFNRVDPNTFFDSVAEQTIFTEGTKLYLTPLAALDPGMCQLYMSFNEWESLPEFTYAKACRIKVTPLGYRLPFQTNESSAGYANSQTLVQCASSVGLNTMYNMALTNYEIDPADPTLVTSTVGTEPDYQGILYGDEENPVGARMGKPVHMNMYTALFHTPYDPETEDPTSLNLIDNIKIQNVNDCKGTPIIDFKHEFKNGLLRATDQTFSGPRSILAATTSGYLAKASEGVNQTRYNQYTNEPNTTSGQPGQFRELDTWRRDGFALGYLNTIEKSYYLQNQIAQHQTPDYSPLVHFGCMPVPSNFALSPTETYAAAVIQWQIECELLCESNLNSTSGNIMNPYLKKWDPIYLDPVANNIPTASGRCIFMCNRRMGITTVTP